MQFEAAVIIPAFRWLCWVIVNHILFLRNSGKTLWDTHWCCRFFCCFGLFWGTVLCSVGCYHTVYFNRFCNSTNIIQHIFYLDFLNINNELKLSVLCEGLQKYKELLKTTCITFKGKSLHLKIICLFSLDTVNLIMGVKVHISRQSLLKRHLWCYTRLLMKVERKVHPHTPGQLLH